LFVAHVYDREFYSIYIEPLDNLALDFSKNIGSSVWNLKILVLSCQYNRYMYSCPCN